MVGWDYNTLIGQGQMKRYALPSLRGESFISITLTWNRQVNKMTGRNTSNDTPYAPGDDFAAAPLANLDLYLVPRGSNDLTTALWSSISTNYNIEHIFFQLPAGNTSYDILVRQAGTTGAPYALAWWGVSTPVQQP